MTGSKWVSVFAIVFFVMSLAIVTQAKPKTPDCDRQCLGKVLDTYFDSIEKHKPSELHAAKNVRFTENGADVKFGEGLWQRGGPATYRLDAIDPEDEQAASNALITDNGKDAILLVRLKVEKKKVTEVETLVVRPGEGQRSDPAGLAKLPNPYKDVVPESGRGNREQLVSAAAAYLDALGKTFGGGDPPTVPIAPDGVRFENGFQTSGLSRGGQPPVSLAESFKRPRPAGRGPTMTGSGVFGRRYPVVDLEHGIVLAIGTMTLHLPPGSLDGPPLHAQAKPGGLRLQVLSEFFKVSDGQIHQIQATMYDLDDPKITNPGWPGAQ